MKKKILLIFISFFMFSPSCFALAKVNSMTINVKLDENGTALVEEVWQLNSQDNQNFEKNFIEIKDANIKDISISDSKNNYELVKKYNKSKNFVYSIQESKNKEKIKFNTNGQETTINLQYMVEGMIKSFADFNALDWHFLSLESNQEIGSLNINISGPVGFNENNTALYGIGDNLSLNLSEGSIHVFASNLNAKANIRILASFTDLTYSKAIKENGKFLDYYNHIVNESPILKEIKKVLNSAIFIVISVIIIILILVALIYHFVKNKSLYNDYKEIIPYNKERSIGELNLVPYQDVIPCEGDIYKIYFFANYYNILKHRSSLIGAIMFKWILEGTLKITENDGKSAIIIADGKTFERDLDNELYNILKKASNNLVLDNKKLIRYCITENESIIKWYDKVVKESVQDEYNKQNIKVKGKKIVLNNNIYNEAVDIQGLKRYLLNFNQVPRKSELTEEVYRESLVLSILLGVDKNLYQEILRKNPDNELALALQEFSTVKYIYKNLYSSVYEEYKKYKKHKEKRIYLPKKD